MMIKRNFSFEKTDAHAASRFLILLGSRCSEQAFWLKSPQLKETWPPAQAMVSGTGTRPSCGPKRQRPHAP